MSACDARDANLREILPVPALAPRVLTAPLLEHDDPGRVRLLDQLGGDGRSVDERRAELDVVAVADEQNLFEFDLAPGVSGKLFDGQDIVLGDAVLLAARLDDSVHGICLFPRFTSALGL